MSKSDIPSSYLLAVNRMLGRVKDERMRLDLVQPALQLYGIAYLDLLHMVNTIPDPDDAVEHAERFDGMA